MEVETGIGKSFQRRVSESTAAAAAKAGQSDLYLRVDELIGVRKRNMAFTRVGRSNQQISELAKKFHSMKVTPLDKAQNRDVGDADRIALLASQIKTGRSRADKQHKSQLKSFAAKKDYDLCSPQQNRK